MAKPLPKDFIVSFLEEFKMLPHHARVQITVTHCYLELLVHLLAIHKCKNGQRIKGSHRDYPHSVKTVMLHEMGLISDRQAEVLHWFRQKRNEAAHEALFSISTADLAIFKGVKAVIYAGPKVPKLIEGPALDDPKNFHFLCLHIVIELWNSHVEFFSPLFKQPPNK
jgi:hypothetical protein